MTKLKLFFLLFFSVVFAGSFTAINNVQAQSVGIQISPVKIEELVEPGEKLQKYVKVKNNSDSDKTFFISLRDFEAGDESGRPVLIDPGSKEGNFLATWLEIPTDGIEFKPFEEKTINFFINVPDNVGPGGYYGGIFFGTKPPKLDINSADKGAGMTIAQQNGALILLQVKGEAFEEAMIREFRTNQELYSTPYDVDFKVRIENIGNVHVKPYGKIEIKNMFGHKVAEVIVNKGGGNTMPKSIRTYTSLTWAGKQGFGRYQADLGLSYGISVKDGGQGKKSLVATKYFWIMPWNIIIPLSISLLIVIALFIFLLRLYRNKAIKKAMEQMGLMHKGRRQQTPSPTGQFFIIFVIVFIVVFLVVSSVYFLFFS